MDNRSTDERVEHIRHRLETALVPSVLTVQDESAAHRGHAGARGGGGHFNVIVISEEFINLPLLQRHRMIYDALKDMMEKDIHALRIQALTPDEAQQRNLK